MYSHVEATLKQTVCFLCEQAAGPEVEHALGAGL